LSSIDIINVLNKAFFVGEAAWACMGWHDQLLVDPHLTARCTYGGRQRQLRIGLFQYRIPQLSRPTAN
jgi:hypothetical protein